ncbi:ComEC/Rec2 family competence protein [Pontibacter ruber]|uniref:ComEC/Rec2 family competence protein n=1 Tax=Pontibacter ruber TaxID=1343895 RepID=A0ABW5CYK4_9BACT|nr:ComEC/Rec2 family competence protein [Pontibacter ruber]
MLRWAPYPFVRVTLSFIAGILLYIFSGRDLPYTLEVFAFFVAAYLVAVILSWRLKSAIVTAAAGILALLCFAAGGAWFTNLNTESHQPNHLSKLPSAATYYTGVVDDYVMQKPGYQSTVLSVEQLLVDGEWKSASGKVQLSIPHDSDKEYEVGYGDRLLIKGAPQPVTPALNPNQFDYRAYLANKQVYHRHYLQSHQYLKVGSAPPNPILYFSIHLRRKLDSLLKEHIAERREYGISSALILGVKDELDNEILKVYNNTGTTHVLAVSGLHVALIYGVLMLALVHVNRTRKQRIAVAVALISFLWLYAFVTGLSPSVLRAVVMFSLVTVARAISRQSNIYNTLAVAAFFLLLYNPYYLLDVGFQLSFLAVLGIVYLQPLLYKTLEFDNRLLDKVWVLFTVSVAAQLITFPLGLLYFHQFPVYFWLANLVVVPVSTGVLYTGMAALAFSWVPFLSFLLFQLHFWTIWFMNEFTIRVHQLPQALIQGIDISAGQAWMLYALMLCFILFLVLRRLPYLVLATGIVAILAVQEIREGMQQQQQRALTIYSLRGTSALSLVRGQDAIVLADKGLELDERNYTFNMQPHLWHKGIEQPAFATFSAANLPSGISHALLPDSNSLYVWQGQKLLVISRPLKVQPKAALSIDYVLLTNSARVNPEDLLPFSFKHLILDASNKPWYLQRMRQQLTTTGIPFYDVTEKGAFVVEVE